MTADAHIMFWTATKELSFARAKLFEAGFKCQPIPLIWMKSDGRGVTPDPRFHPRHSYETALFAYRGERRIAAVVDDVFATPTVNMDHQSEKPLALLRHFFRLFVDKHTRMLDPTCGSGNAVRVAEEIGAKYSLGLEVSEEIHARARTNLRFEVPKVEVAL